MSKTFSGKSLISKEKAIQTSEKECYEETMGIKLKADPVFFISLVGVDETGTVSDHEHIFDVYTREYDFDGYDVKVISAQDLWVWYKTSHKDADKKRVNIYQLSESFIQHNPNGHYVFDECPFLIDGK